MDKTLEVTCQGTTQTIAYDQLTDFQGGLKKRTDEEVRKIVQSLTDYGFSFPFFVWHHEDVNYCLDGHGRMAALAMMSAEGWNIPDLPYVLINCHDEKDAKQKLLRLNSQYGHMTRESVLEFADGIEVKWSDIQLPKVGEIVISDMQNVETEEDDGGKEEIAEQLQKKWGTERGQLWILGDHRLLIGDSTLEEDVRRLMGDERAVLCNTDPPYLVGYNGHKHNGSPDWENLEEEGWDENDKTFELYHKFIEKAKEYALKNGFAFYIWYASKHHSKVEGILEKNKILINNQIVWVKDRPIIGRTWYMYQHEPCMFGWETGSKPERMGSEYESTVWMFPTVKPGITNAHPTSKPVELFSIPIRQHMRNGEICYEPFCGSGTQIIAAEQLGVRCYAMEISPAFGAVILDRWSEYTGKKPVKQ